jgi:hypothetical protein
MKSWRRFPLVDTMSNSPLHRTDFVLGFQKPEIEILTTRFTSNDAQPSPHGGIMIQVTGTIAVSISQPFPQTRDSLLTERVQLSQDLSDSMSFARTFALLPEPDQPGD